MKSSGRKTVIKLIIVIFTISIIALIISLTFLAVVQEIKTLDIQLTVANHMGFNVDTDKIYLGTVPAGNTGSRGIIVENKEYEKSVVRLKVRGELKEWITVSENNFVLKKGESKLVKVEVKVPQDAAFKDYQGRLLVIFTRI